MLLDTGLHNRFWGEAICTAAYLQKRLLSRSITKTPHEHWYDSKPDVSCIRIFGSKVYSLVPKQVHKKWDDKAMVGVLVGFDTAAKGYRILDPEINKVWVSRSVHIIESVEGTLPSDNSPEPEVEVKTENNEINVNSLISEQSSMPPEDDTTHLEADNMQSCSESPEQKRETPHRSQRPNRAIPPKKLSYKVEIDDLHEPASWEDMMSLSSQV
jgi:hypothetical protein